MIKKSLFFYQIITYIIVFIIIYFFTYSSNNYKISDITQKDILYLNEKSILDRKKLYDIPINYQKLWFDKNDTKIKVHKKIIKDIIKKNNTICISKKCFDFLAIVNKNNKLYAVFYSNFFKATHIKLFLKNTNLYDKIYLKDVFQDYIIISEYNTTNEWKFLLFDINLSKYKPKGKNEI